MTLIQWSGSTGQRQTVPWVQIGSYANVLSLSDKIENDLRVWRNFSTAVGEALSSSLAALEDANDCTRKAVDVSGGGVSNQGSFPAIPSPRVEGARCYRQRIGD